MTESEYTSIDFAVDVNTTDDEITDIFRKIVENKRVRIKLICKKKENLENSPLQLSITRHSAGSEKYFWLHLYNNNNIYERMLQKSNFIKEKRFKWFYFRYHLFRFNGELRKSETHRFTPNEKTAHQAARLFASGDQQELQAFLKNLGRVPKDLMKFWNELPRRKRTGYPLRIDSVLSSQATGY